MGYKMYLLKFTKQRTLAFCARPNVVTTLLLLCFLWGTYENTAFSQSRAQPQRGRQPARQPTRQATPVPQPLPYLPPPQQPYAPVPPAAVPAPQPFAYPPPYVYLTPTPTPDSGFQGLDRFYAQGSVGFRSETLSRADPQKEPNRPPPPPRVDQNYSLLDNGIIGWGPVRFRDFVFNVHYGYYQDWGTQPEQVSDRFLKRWFSKPTMENFIFPTKSMIRTHEITSDLKFATSTVQAGVFSRIAFSRTGSSILGSKLEAEVAQKQMSSENFVPYVSYRHGRFYQGEVAMPFRTEINHEDSILSNKTYDWYNRGRGRMWSVMTNHRFYLPSMHSHLFVSAYLLQMKFGSLQQDRLRGGADLALDFPVVLKLRAVPRFSYFQDTFSLDRIRTSETATRKLERVDDFNGFGLGIYYDFTRRQRVNVDLTLEQTISTIPDHKTSRIAFVLGYTYSYPSTSAVVRKTQRFTEDGFADDF